MSERTSEPVDSPLGDLGGREGGHAAAGEPAGTRGQLDSAGGGYGSQSGTATSGGTGDGEPASGVMDDGTTSAGTGATGQGPTEWLRSEPVGSEGQGESGSS
jgi:hypothetical protein